MDQITTATQPIVIGIDAGGTMTDTILVDQDGRFKIGKSATTPANEAEGFLASAEDAAEAWGISLEALFSGVNVVLYSGTGMPYAYPDTSGEEIKAWTAKYKARTGQEPNSAAQYAYAGSDLILKALEAAGKDLTRAKFIAALESIKDYRGMFPGPAISYGPNRHQGSTATFLAKVEGGRWKVVAENLMY